MLVALELRHGKELLPKGEREGVFEAVVGRKRRGRRKELSKVTPDWFS
jgi:hypothetical protein